MTKSPLNRLRPGPLFALCVTYVALVAVVDYWTVVYTLANLYLVATLVCAWFGGRWPGIFITLFSTACMVTADLLNGNVEAVHLWNIGIEQSVTIVVSLLTSKLRELYTTEQQFANRDPLTGLPNRRSFFEVAEFLLPVSRRGVRPVTLAYLDLDGFKWVNDTFGHEAGDDVLRTVAEILQTKLRASDLVARLGGDEFVIFFPEAGFQDSGFALKKLLSELRQVMATKGWPVDFSVGAVTYASTPPGTMDDLLKAADTLMYEAKRTGKGTLQHVER